MNIANTIKKIEKLTGAKIKTNENNLHWVEFKGYSICFYPNGRMSPDAAATCHHIQKIGSEHVGYRDNIKQCFDSVNRLSA